MTILSLADSCRLLAIDAKTLHRWLSLAHISVQAHPLDARLKCVTCEQVQQLAATHRRTLPELSEQPFPAAPSVPSIPSDVRAASVWSSVVSEVSTPITELTQQLGSLQIQVVTLQHQLALLTEQLQKEQQWRISVTKTFEDNSLESSLEKPTESSLEKSAESSLEKSAESSLEKPTESSLEKSAESSLEKSAESSLEKPAESSLEKPAESSLEKPAESSLEKESVPTSIDRRKHPRVLPLVEYGAQGNYVVISPEQGLLELAPDSPEWFAWLSTLPSFRFVGLHGRLTAFRGYQCSPHTSWWAHRQIRNHSHKRRLGLTDSVTIASLELAASSLQALV
jgi:TolA-binding protein